MKKKLLFLFLLLSMNVQNFCFAECFDQHLAKAIRINTMRLPKYLFISYGDTLLISQKLILGETLLLPKAKQLMLKAKYFQDKGIPVLCDEFLPMSQVAPWSSQISPLSTPLNKVDLNEFKLKSQVLIQQYNWIDLQLLIRKTLSEKFHQIQYYCMTKHFIESMSLITEKALLHAQMAEQKQLPSSPNGLSQELLQIHIDGLFLAESLDIDASEVQQNGIPIICQDVPKL